VLASCARARSRAAATAQTTSWTDAALGRDRRRTRQRRAARSAPQPLDEHDPRAPWHSIADRGALDLARDEHERIAAIAAGDPGLARAAAPPIATNETWLREHLRPADDVPIDGRRVGLHRQAEVAPLTAAHAAAAARAATGSGNLRARSMIDSTG
jgi:hypothetical protein